MDLYIKNKKKDVCFGFMQNSLQVFTVAFMLILSACGSQVEDDCNVGDLNCSCFDNDLCGDELSCSSGICIESESSLNYEVDNNSSMPSPQDDKMDEPESLDDLDDSTDDGATEVSDDTSMSEVFYCEQRDVEHSFESAVNLGFITDMDDEGGDVVGTLDGRLDEDWFHYLGQDDFFGYTDPFVKVNSTEVLELCMYVACVSADPTEFTCPNGSETVAGDFSAQGCCVTGESASIFIEDLECGGNENAEVYLQVKGNTQNMCLNYSLDYNY